MSSGFATAGKRTGESTPGPILCALALAGCGSSGPDWYRHAVFYEPFVRSFQDGDGDGIGDLPGLTARLGELESLSVDALWLLKTDQPSVLLFTRKSADESCVVVIGVDEDGPATATASDANLPGDPLRPFGDATLVRNGTEAWSRSRPAGWACSGCAEKTATPVEKCVVSCPGRVPGQIVANQGEHISWMSSHICSWGRASEEGGTQVRGAVASTQIQLCAM